MTHRTARRLLLLVTAICPLATGMDVFQVSDGEVWMRRFVLSLGWLSVGQSLWNFGRQESLMQEIAGRVLSPESNQALQAVREIFDRVEDHGVVDVFHKYKAQDLWPSITALSRLQHAHREYLQRRQSTMSTPLTDAALLSDLAYYSVYASVSYGWKMDLALSGRLHWGDLQALLRRTGSLREDVLAAEWEARTHRPAYFVVRDRIRKSLVVCIRGTWSPHDVLTDLCCTSQDFETPRGEVSALELLSEFCCAVDEFEGGFSVRRVAGHHGMLEAAKALQKHIEELVEKELTINPDYSLVLVGHSMGGGVAALLGAIWERTYSPRTFVYGPPCVGPKDARPTASSRIYSVVREGDPWCCISLGHVADVSVSLSKLCEDVELRDEVTNRTEGGLNRMSLADLKWCSETLNAIRGDEAGKKLFPPGRLFLLPEDSSDRRSLLEVQADYFEDMVVSSRMFDLSKHFPAKYEELLQGIVRQS